MVIPEALGTLILLMQSWRARVGTPDVYTKVYNRNIDPDAFNGRYYKYIWQTLKEHDIQAFTYITPQNPAVIDRVMTPKEYQKNRDIIHSFFNDPAIPFKDFSTIVPDELFYDNDHLLAEGNKLVAQHLGAELLPIISSRTGWQFRKTEKPLHMAEGVAAR